MHVVDAGAQGTTTLLMNIFNIFDPWNDRYKMRLIIVLKSVNAKSFVRDSFGLSAALNLTTWHWLLITRPDSVQQS